MTINPSLQESEWQTAEGLTLLSKRMLPEPLFPTNEIFGAPHPFDFPKRKRIVASNVYLTSGALLAYAPNGNATDKSFMGLGGSAGIGYEIQIKYWIFSTGVTINYRTGINNDLQYNRKYYGSRLYTETDQISYKAITRLEFPLSANYIVDKNVFGMSVIPVYNAAVNSTYQRFNSYNDDQLVVKNNFGIRDGIKKYDLKVQVSYSRRISESLEFGGNASLGLFNQIDTGIISDSKGYRDISLGVFMKYNFLRF